MKLFSSLYCEDNFINASHFFDSMILKTLCFTLGIVVREEREDKCDQTAQVIIANHLSMLDYIPIHLLTGCVTVHLFAVVY